MAENTEQFSELLERLGTTRNGIERGNAGARIIEGWEQLVKTTASKTIPGREEVNSMRQISKMVG